MTLLEESQLFLKIHEFAGAKSWKIQLGRTRCGWTQSRCWPGKAHNKCWAHSWLGLTSSWSRGENLIVGRLPLRVLNRRVEGGLWKCAHTFNSSILSTRGWTPLLVRIKVWKIKHNGWDARCIMHPGYPRFIASIGVLCNVVISHICIHTKGAFRFTDTPYANFRWVAFSTNMSWRTEQPTTIHTKSLTQYQISPNTWAWKEPIKTRSLKSTIFF